MMSVRCRPPPGWVWRCRLICRGLLMLPFIDGRCVSYSAGPCQHVLGDMSPVYVQASVADSVSVTDSIIADLLSQLTPQCQNVTLGTLCRYAFPKCTVTADVIKSKPLCRESCDALLQSSCWSGDEHISFLNCSSLPSQNISELCTAVELKKATGEIVVGNVTEGRPSMNEVVIAVIVSVPVGLLLSVVVLVVVRMRHGNVRCQKPTVSSPPADNVDIDITCLPLNDAYVPPQSPPPDSAEYSPVLSPLEYARNGLQFCEDLCPGAFGPIFVAQAPGIAGRSAAPVATLPFVVVKALRGDASDEARRDFVRIGELLSRLVHPKIVRLLGVCLSASPLCLIVEYMPGRDLCEFLQQHAPQHFIVRHGLSTSSSARLKSADLIGAARQIADAMVYVSDHRFVHRDLAARNCLVGDRGAARLEVKLSDFGLAVELGDQQDYYCGEEDEEMPVRWMPPEAIRDNRFTHSSDVWSFGILLWEIFTFGMQPYEHMSIKEVIRVVDSGRMLHCPEHASNAVYEQMQLCWRHSPSARPQFRDLLKQLTKLEDVARADIRFS